MNKRFLELRLTLTLSDGSAFLVKRLFQCLKEILKKCVKQRKKCLFMFEHAKQRSDLLFLNEN